MILDTACARSVMGCPALTVEEADRTGIEYVFKNDNESFKFGASRRTSPLGCQWLVVRGGAGMRRPVLAGLTRAEEAQGQHRRGGENMDFGVLKGESFILVQAQGGHPAMAVFPEGEAKPPHFAECGA